MLVVNRWQLNSQLLVALRNGDSSSAVSLLDSGLDCDIQFRLGGRERNAVSLAVERGHTDLVALLCDRRCSLSQSDSEGFTPLHIAASLGHLAICKLLLDNRADLGLVTSFGDTPLHLAVCSLSAPVVALLVSAGALLNQRNAAGKTPLMLAAEKGNLPIIQILVAAGADRAATDKLGNSALLLNVGSPYVSAGSVNLLACAGSVSLVNKAGVSPLHHMVTYCRSPNKREALKALLDGGADPNVASVLGQTGLDLACLERDWDSAHQMILAGARIVGPPDCQARLSSPLFMALQHGNFKIAEALVGAGADPKLHPSRHSQLGEEAKAWLRSKLTGVRGLKEWSRRAAWLEWSGLTMPIVEATSIPVVLESYMRFEYN